MSGSRAWLRPWRGAIVYQCAAVGFFVTCGSLQAQSGRANSSSGREQAPPAKSAADHAHLEPGPVTETPKDLELSPELRREADALAAFVDGFIAEDEANPEKALEQYQRVLALDPGYVELAIKVAAEFERRGKTADAINVLKDAIKSSPRASLPKLYLAGLYLRALKKPDQAEKYANEAIATEPGNPAGWRMLFDIYVATDQSDKAEQLIDRAAKSPATEPAFWMELVQMAARIYLREDGSAEEASLAKYNQILSRAAAVTGEDVNALVRLADFYVISRQVSEAIPLYLKALTLRPEGNDPLIASARDKLARSFRYIGNKEEAIKILAELARKNPERFETHEMLGELYEETGDFDKALASFEKSLELDNSEPAAYVRVGHMYLQIYSRTKTPAHAEKAVKILKEAREKFPDVGAVTYSLATALSRAAAHEQALQAFEDALTEFSNSQPEMVNHEFYLAYGAAAEQAGQIDTASDLIKKSIELNSEYAEALNYLGYMWIDRDMNLDEAGQYVARALQIEPDNPAFLDSMGWYYYKKGEYDKALVELLKAAETIQPEDAVVFDHVGDTYLKLGKPAQALGYWQKALTLEPDNKKIAEKIDGIKQKVTAAPQATEQKQ